MNEEVSWLLLDKASQGLGSMKLTRYVMQAYFYHFSLIDSFFLKSGLIDKRPTLIVWNLNFADWSKPSNWLLSIAAVCFLKKRCLFHL
jgi:hypothetical protein